jgi:hypothetical protein
MRKKSRLWSFLPLKREQIANMDEDCGKYCIYPGTEEWIKDDYAKIKAWMADAHLP